MDKAKGLAKSGWDKRPIHRETLGLKAKQKSSSSSSYEDRMNHQSAPLRTLRDPDSFGPPPKQREWYGEGAAARPGQPPPPSGGLGSPVPAPSRYRQQEQIEEAPKPPPGPYQVDTSGLRTDHLPKPPMRRTTDDMGGPVRTSSPSLPPRQAAPVLPGRQAVKPPPSLPPRQNENPSIFSPPPPPPYGEAVQAPQSHPSISPIAPARVASPAAPTPSYRAAAPSPAVQPPPAATPRAPQLSELQQRFARMNTGASSQEVTTPVPAPANVPSAPTPAHKKAAPPPPPKKSALAARPVSIVDASEPPPLPLASKPRPT